jgi:hypothetical protein
MTATKSYVDLETFQDGRVIIYRRRSSASQNFHTRIRLSGVTGYAVKSCKTSDRNAAYRFAMDLYEDMRVKVLAGETINAPNAYKIIDEFLETPRVQSANLYRDINQIIGKHFRSYSQVKPWSGGFRWIFNDAAVAHLVERLIRNQEVGGSSPLCGTTPLLILFTI